MTRLEALDAGRRLRNEPFEMDRVGRAIAREVMSSQLTAKARAHAEHQALQDLASYHPATAGPVTVQQWWTDFETHLLEAARLRERGRITSAAARALVTSRTVTASWPLLDGAPVAVWARALPDDDPVSVAYTRLRSASSSVTWAAPISRDRSVACGVRVLLRHGYDTLESITENDLNDGPYGPTGVDLLDAWLCELGIFDRSPQRGTTRRFAEQPRTVEYYAGLVPEVFRPVVIAYVHAYRARSASSTPPPGPRSVHWPTSSST